LFTFQISKSLALKAAAEGQFNEFISLKVAGVGTIKSFYPL